jgi:hypothetical protein
MWHNEGRDRTPHVAAPHPPEPAFGLRVSLPALGPGPYRVSVPGVDGRRTPGDTVTLAPPD